MAVMGQALADLTSCDSQRRWEKWQRRSRYLCWSHYLIPGAADAGADAKGAEAETGNED